MPDWKSIIEDRIANLHLGGAAEVGLREEMAQHLQDRYDEFLSGGASEEQAVRKTVAELDDTYPLRAAVGKIARLPKQEGQPVNFIDDFWRDLRYGVRAMRKGPLFVIFVVPTLALGIGANTTVFTVINTLLLNPLPIPESSKLISLFVGKNGDTKNAGAPLPMSYADLKDYQARSDIFKSLAGNTKPQVITWQSGGISKRLFSELVTGNYFSALGIGPAKGRFFLPDEDGQAGAHAVAVLNYGTWQSTFGGASDVLGKTLRLNNVNFTIVGIAPPHFIGVNAIFGPDLWIPAAMSEQLLPGEMQNALTDRGKEFFQGVGRLNAGVSQSSAQAAISTVAANLAREYPETHAGRTATIRPVRDTLFSSASSGSGGIFFASVGLSVVVGIVLLIACSNVANLLLARSAARQQEIAVRLAMGASRVRLVRQLLTESTLLAFLSGVVGLALAYAGLRLLWSSLPSSANFIAPKLDVNVLAYSLLISLATGLLFGAIPAVKASRADVIERLKEETRTAGRSRRRVTVGNVLLAGQVALSFLLLLTSALFLRSIGHAYDINPGFQTAHLAVLMTNPGQVGYTKAQTKTFYKEARERVENLPGVQSVSWSSNLPLWARVVSGLEIEGRERRSQADRITSIEITVDTGYFETAGVTIERGRAFSNVDREESAPVAIVNERVAHDFWPRGDALGKRIQLPDEKQLRQIVGIARTASYTNWGEPAQLAVYVPLDQHYVDAMTLYVRAKGDPKGVLLAAQREIHAISPQMFLDVRTGRQIVDGGLFQGRIGVMLLGVFGLLALALASVGLYGILAYSVNQRQREIGLRMALGAARANVLGLVLKEGMLLVATGVLVGFVGGLLVGRAIDRLLYGVKPSDPLSVLGAAAVLFVVALAACYLPARRASRIDPLVALREG